MAENLHDTLDFSNLSVTGLESRNRQLFESGLIDIYTYQEISRELAQASADILKINPSGGSSATRATVGAAAGATAGSIFGPAGAIIGGFIGSFFGRGESKRERRSRLIRARTGEAVEDTEGLAISSATQQGATFISRHRATERLKIALEGVGRRR